jgi:hypothetical protein
MSLHQNGTPSFFTRILANVYMLFSGKGTGSVGLISRPRLSPDLSLVDFMKDVMQCFPLPTTLIEVQQYIMRVIVMVDQAMLRRMWEELDHLMNVRRATKGAYIANV